MDPVARSPRAFRPEQCQSRPLTEHAHCAVQTWRGCVVVLRRARSSPRRWPGLDQTMTATGRPHEVRTIVDAPFKIREARTPRFRAMKYRPIAHGARAPRSADLAWLYCSPTRGALLRAPPAGAWPHEHRDRSMAPTETSSDSRFQILRRAARALFAPKRAPTGRPQSTRTAQCGLGVVVL